MSLIDDIVGKKLPTGRKFQARVGAGNVKSKLYSATRYGSLKNLADNQDIINDIAFKRQSKIRSGNYTRDMLEADFSEAVKSGNLSADDKKDLRSVLEHWSKGESPKKPDQSTKKMSATTQRAKAEEARVRPAPRRELPDFLKNRAKSSINTNPWTDTVGGSGGGIGSGSNQGRATRQPTLLR